MATQTTAMHGDRKPRIVIDGAGRGIGRVATLGRDIDVIRHDTEWFPDVIAAPPDIVLLSQMGPMKHMTLL